MFDGKITKEEKRALIEIYQDDKDYYLKLLKEMKNLLNRGHIHKLTKILLKEFNI